MMRELGMLPFILAFIYEQTFSRKGRMEENGAIGATFMVDLKSFLLGRDTSISVDKVITSGEMTGLGNEPMIISCNSFTIC